MQNHTEMLSTLVALLKVAQTDEERRRIARLIVEDGGTEDIELAHILSGTGFEP